MADQDLKTLSKKNWTTSNTTSQELNTSCFMRMADSLEMIAKDKAELERKLQSETERKEMWMKLYRKECNRSSAFKGQVTRLKNQLKSK